MRFLVYTVFLLGFCSVDSYAGVGNANLPSSQTVTVGVKTLTFFDHNSHRPLITEVWYPAKNPAKTKVIETVWQGLPESRDALPQIDVKHPLIIFSHGDGGSRLDGAWLAHALVQKGYIVAAVDHYENTYYLNFSKTGLQRWLRPRDISFVVRQLINHSQFSSVINPNKVGFCGYSLGGLTGIWLAGGIANLYKKPLLKQASKHSSALESMVELPKDIEQADIDTIDFSLAKASYHDPIIKAEFLMAPAYGFAFDAAGLQSIHIPIMIVAGESDQIVPIKENAIFYNKGISKSVLKVFPGKVGHFVFLNQPSALGVKQLPEYLTRDKPGVNRNKIHHEVAELAVQFFNQALQNK